MLVGKPFVRQVRGITNKHVLSRSPRIIMQFPDLLYIQSQTRDTRHVRQIQAGSH